MRGYLWDHELLNSTTNKHKAAFPVLLTQPSESYINHSYFLGKGEYEAYDLLALPRLISSLGFLSLMGLSHLSIVLNKQWPLYSTK